MQRLTQQRNFCLRAVQSSGAQLLLEPGAKMDELAITIGLGQIVSQFIKDIAHDIRG